VVRAQPRACGERHLVEVIPAYDPAGQTAFLAANLAHEMLSLVALRRGPA
jgi:arginase family enzyme